MAPVLAPKTNSSAPSMYGLVARSGRGSTRQSTSVASRVTDALACLSSSWPVRGIATNAPAAMHNRQNPTVAFEMPRWSCSHGMCATHVPMTAPLTAKIRNVASRGVNSHRSEPR